MLNPANIGDDHSGCTSSDLPAYQWASMKDRAAMASSDPHPSTLAVEALLADCDVERLRRSGPGGQHRNKVETAVRLTHRPTDVTAMASERRSQAANLSQAIRRLRINMAIEVRRPAAAEPSPLWTSRCVGGRIRVNPQHDDFPAILAEALDVLQSTQWDVAQAAEFLGCTLSQLLKLLREEPRALVTVNKHRVASGKPIYH